ncbi:hypothetical protein M9Y10_022868 [Tritrichomonas musculus]|uniref:Ankyrin repeat protein n=1 Tax=Tritrichomonas musculus TaxID=1915356 RepID=A0ABR2KTJ9_9EUKA
MYNNMSLFEYTIQNEGFEIADSIIRQPSITVFSEFSSYFAGIEPNKYLEESTTLIEQTDNDSDFEDSYAFNLIHFFDQKNSNDECINQVVQKNKEFLACIAAQYLNEDEFVGFLEKFKIEVSSIYKENKLTPIISSIANKKYDVLKIIITKYKDEVNINSAYLPIELTALHILSYQKRQLREGDKILLSLNDLDVNKHEKTHSFTPLHLAVLNHNCEFIRLLLNHPGIDINCQDCENNTPLHHAFSFRISCSLGISFETNIEVLKLLLDCTNKKIDTIAKNKRVPFLVFFY